MVGLLLLTGLVVSAGIVSSALLTKVLGFDAPAGSIKCGTGYVCSAPPDPMGAVDLDQFLGTTHGSQAVYSKGGALLQLYNLFDFWDKPGLPGGNRGD